MKSEILASFIIVVVCVFYIQPCLSFRLNTANESETSVTYTTGGSYRRKRSADVFPPEINIDFFADGIEVKLQLLRNYRLSAKVPLFVYRSEVVEQDVVDSDPVAFYQESNNGSSFMVYQNSGSQTDQLFKFFGTFEIGQHIFLMQPPDGQHDSHTVSRVVEELPTLTDFLQKYEDEDRPPRRRHTDRKDNSDETAFHREKREIIEYEIEIFIVVDFGVYSFWYDQTTGTDQERADATMNYIRQFYAFVINAINGRYKSVTGKGYTITCLFAGIYIADSKSGAPFIEDRIVDSAADLPRAVAGDVLGNFTDWGNSNLNTANFDHAMMFTAYDIGYYYPNGTFKSSTAGLAWVSELCTDNKFSINEDHFDVAVVTIAAHELGHNVGSYHDGSNNSCNATGGYIMAPSSGTTSDPDFNKLKYKFSPCSLVYFDDYIDTLTADNNNCMLTLSSTYDPATNDQYVNDTAGQVYPPDVQCENIIGQGSYLHRRVFKGDYSSICGVMYCTHTANDGLYFYKTAWEGTSCGNGKLCELGNCVSSAKAATGLTENCLFGDIPYTLSSSSQTCEEFLGSSTTSYRCYTDSYRYECCVSCQVHQQNNIGRTEWSDLSHLYVTFYRADCKYGDKVSWCDSMALGDCYSNDDNCCQSCPDRALNISDCEYGDKASWCAGLELWSCYSNDGLCCQSCPERALSIPDCLYGDKATGCDAASCDSYSESNKAMCCETCAMTTTTTTTTTTSTTTTPAPTITTTTTPTTTTPTTTSTTSTTTTTTTTTTTPTITTTTPTTTTTTTTTTPTTTTTTPTTTTPTTTTTTPTITTTTPTTTTITPTTITTTPTTTTPTTTTTTPTTTTTTPTTTTPTITSTTPTATTTTPKTTTTTPSTTTTTPTTTTPTITTTSQTTTTPTTTTTTPTTTTTTPTTTTTTATTKTTTQTTTTPTITTTTPTTTSPTTATTTPTTTTTTSTTTTPTTTTTTPMTTTTVPTTTTPTTTTTTPTSTTPTITTTTPTTTTTTPTTKTPTTMTTTPTTTTITLTSTTPTTTTTTPTTTTTTPTATTTTPTTTTTTPTTTTTTTTTTTPTTMTTTPTTTTPTTTTSTPTTTTPTTTITTPTTTTTSPTTTTTTPTTTKPTTTTTTPTITILTPITTTTTPTTTTLTTKTPTTITTTPTTTTTTPTTTTTTPTTTTPTTTTTTPTTTTSTTTTTIPTTTITTLTTPTKTTPTSTKPTTTTPTTMTTPTTTTTTPTTTTPTTTTSTTTTSTTTTPTTTTTIPTTTITTPTTTTTTPTTTTTTPTTTTPTTTTATPTTTTTSPTTTTTTPTTTTPTITTTTPTTTTTTPTTTTLTTTTPTTTTTTPTTTAPTTTTTTSTTMTTTPTTTTTTPTTTISTATTTTPTTTTTAPTTTTTAPTITTTAPTTTTTTPTTTTPTTTTTTPTTTTPTTTTITPTTTTTTPTTTTTTTTTTTATTTTMTTATTTTLKPGIRKVFIVLVFSITIRAVDFNNENSQSYQDLLLVVIIELHFHYKKFMGANIKAIGIRRLRKGSLIVEYDVEYEDTPETAAELTNANVGIVSGQNTITIQNKTVSASSVEINNVTVTNTSVNDEAKVCSLFLESFGGCGSSHYCSVVDGSPTCIPMKTEDGLKLILGIAVGMPVFLLLVLLIIAFTVRALRLKHKRHSSDKTFDTDMHNRSASFKGWANPYVNAAPYGGINSWGFKLPGASTTHLDSSNGGEFSSFRTSSRDKRRQQHARRHDAEYNQRHVYDNPGVQYDDTYLQSHYANDY